jgi:zinc protease
VEVPQVVLPTERKRVDVIIPGKSNASIVIGHPSTLLRTADDFFASRLVNGILGGDTISGRLGVAVRRDAGLTYGIYSSFGDTTKGGAPWTIELSVNPQNVDKALSIIDKVMDDFVKNGVTAEELSLEAKSTAGTFIVQLRRFDAIASTINEYEFLGLGIEALDEYATRIQSVTLEEANAAIRKYIRPELFVTAVAGSLK